MPRKPEPALEVGQERTPSILERADHLLNPNSVAGVEVRETLPFVTRYSLEVKDDDAPSKVP